MKNGSEFLPTTRGNSPVVKFWTDCRSDTTIENPVVADVTGDGSADILVTGNWSGSSSSNIGRVYVFQGGTSKWASAPNVWNQQMYSPLLVNRDLMIPQRIESQTLAFGQTCSDVVETVYLYNGGPMQAPYISDVTYCPVDLSSDVYVAGGTISFTSPTSVTLSVTFGNMGLTVASASTPVRYYKDAIGSANIIGTATLGLDLQPGQTQTLVITLNNLSPMPSQFYVRILDDGTSFPAGGPYSDCNLSNNTKSFGTLELRKTVGANAACINGTSTFAVELANNSGQTFNNIILADSLGDGWQYLSSASLKGNIGAYNATTRKLQWNLASIAPGETALLTLSAKALSAGTILNYVWIEAVDGMPSSKDVIEAYVIVSVSEAPAAASISPAEPILCGENVTLTASASGAISYQWYLNDVEISGAKQSTYAASAEGSYTVSYNNGDCVSEKSQAVVVMRCTFLPVNPHLRIRFGD